MIEQLVIGAVAIASGYIIRGRLARRQFAAARARWQKQVDTLQGQLGLKRVRIQELERDIGRMGAS